MEETGHYNEVQRLTFKRFRKILRYRQKTIFEMRYLNIKNLTVCRIISYYSMLTEIVQNKLVTATLELPLEEAAVVYDCLLHNKKFPEIEFKAPVKAEEGKSIETNHIFHIIFAVRSHIEP